MGAGTLSRNLDVQGIVDEVAANAVGFGSGTVVHVEDGGLFDCESGTGGTIPTLNNDGTLEMHAGATWSVGTFTQSSTSTLRNEGIWDGS